MMTNTSTNWLSYTGLTGYVLKGAVYIHADIILYVKLCSSMRKHRCQFHSEPNLLDDRYITQIPTCCRIRKKKRVKKYFADLLVITECISY